MNYKEWSETAEAVETIDAGMHGNGHTIDIWKHPNGLIFSTSFFSPYNFLKPSEFSSTTDFVLMPSGEIDRAIKESGAYIEPDPYPSDGYEAAFMVKFEGEGADVKMFEFLAKNEDVIRRNFQKSFNQKL